MTRLTIWIRDEIANSVEGEPQEENGAADADGDGPKAESNNDEGVNDSSNEGADDEADEPQEATAEEGVKMIDLSEEAESSDDDESYDELEICHEPEEKPQSLAKSRAPAAKAHEESTLEDSLQTHFGHSAFRPGQEWAIRRCLSHKRTLLVAPTGQGKSLCYALPSLIMPGICIVVSPLISLMQDQLRQLPPKVTAATLSGSITTSQMALIVDDILRGRYKVLFVSPERLASAAFRRLIRPRFNPETRQHERKFPPVSMLCVDEVSCSHAFAFDSSGVLVSKYSSVPFPGTLSEPVGPQFPPILSPSKVVDTHDRTKEHLGSDSHCGSDGHPRHLQHAVHTPQWKQCRRGRRSATTTSYVQWC